MAGRYRPENQTALSLAYKNNMWLRVDGNVKTWYSPAQFELVYGSGNRVPIAMLKILNPLLSLQEGREALIRMIKEGKPAGEIEAKMRRLFAFEDKLIHAGYKPIMGQRDQIPWPYEIEVPKSIVKFANGKGL